MTNLVSKIPSSRKNQKETWNNSSTLKTLRIFPSGRDKNSLRAKSLLSSVGQVFIYSLQRRDIQCGMQQRDGWCVLIEFVKLFLSSLPEQ